jgi:hypothetical protein
MWRQRFLNLTFIVLLLTMLTARELVLVTQPPQDELMELSEGASQVRATFIRFNVGYISQLYPPFTRIGRKLAQLRQRTQILAEWPIESNTTQWEKYYASTMVEKELIEARFHVENAEVYEWSIENRQKTVAELNKAERFLDDARGSLNKKPVLATIERVTKELETMEADTIGKRASQPANYESIKTDLDHVIDWVRMLGDKKIVPVSSSQSS